MGDVVHALPLAVDIAEAVPAAQIDWLCEEAFAAIPAMSRYIGAVHRGRATSLAQAPVRSGCLARSAYREECTARCALRPCAGCAGAGKERVACALDGCAGHGLRFFNSARRLSRRSFINTSLKCRAACTLSSAAGALAPQRSDIRSQARHASALRQAFRNPATTRRRRCCSSTPAAQRSCGHEESLGCGRALVVRSRHQKRSVLPGQATSDCEPSRSRLACSAPKSVPHRPSVR